MSSVLALPCCRRGSSVDWDGGGAEGAPAIGSEEEAPPIASLAACGGGAGCEACLLLTCWPLAEAAVEPAGWMSAAAEGRSDAAKNIWE